MSRKYVKIDEYGKEILEMKAQGKTNREIAQILGVDRECIRNWVFRHNRQQRKWKLVFLPVLRADHARMHNPEILSQSRHMRFND